MNKKTKTMIILFIIGLMSGVVYAKSCNGDKANTQKPIKKITNKTDTIAIKHDTVVAEILHPSINIKANQRIKSPLKISLNSEGLWLASEGEIGIVRLLDDNKNEMAKGFLTSTDGHWMTEKNAQFDCTLKFDPKDAKKGNLIINNNPGEGSGSEAGVSTSFKIPVKF